MTVNEIAMIGLILIYGVIYWLTHDDEDANDDFVEVEGIPIEELD